MPELTIKKMEMVHIEDVLFMWKDLLSMTEEVNDRYQLSDKALDFQREFFIKHLNSETVFNFVALYKSEPIGFSNGYLIIPSKVFNNKHVGLIENIYIKPKFRRKGIGEKIVDHCYKWFLDFGINDVYVNVVPANEISKNFWQSMGYAVHKQTMARSIELES